MVGDIKQGLYKAVRPLVLTGKKSVGLMNSETSSNGPIKNWASVFWTCTSKYHRMQVSCTVVIVTGLSDNKLIVTVIGTCIRKVL